jgi:hypothetical protein
MYIKDVFSKSRLFQIFKGIAIQSIFLLFLSNFLFPELIQSISIQNDYSSEWIELNLESEEASEEEGENEEIESDDLFHSITNHAWNTCLINYINYPPCKLPHFYLNEISTPPPEFS